MADVLLESAEFAAAYTAEIERNTKVRPREFSSRVAQDFKSTKKIVDDDYADYADSQANCDYLDTEQEIHNSRPSQERKADLRVFENPSAEFVDAVNKISPEILRLMKSQFHSEPVRYVEGGIVISKSEDLQGDTSSDSDENDDEKLLAAEEAEEEQ